MPRGLSRTQKGCSSKTPSAIPLSLRRSSRNQPAAFTPETSPGECPSLQTHDTTAAHYEQEESSDEEVIESIRSIKDIEARMKEASTWMQSKTKPNGKQISIRTTANILNLPYNTFLRRQRNISRPYKHAHSKQQKLTAEQENILVEWIILLGYRAAPLKRSTITARVRAILKISPADWKNRDCTKGWFKRFVRRHPEIKLNRPAGLDPKRAQAFNKATVQAHFKLFQEEIIEKHGVLWENIYNMDEKGLQLSGGRKQRREKFLFASDAAQKYRVRNESVEMVSIIECIAADGIALDPGFIFKGKSHNSDHFMQGGNAGEKIGFIAYSENGWTDGPLCFEWFKQVFIPFTKKRSNGKPVALIFDGHDSHTRIEMIELAKEHNVHLFLLPPHTTHYLQPLDVGVFNLVQHYWSKRCDELLQEEISAGESEPQGMRKDIVVKEYLAIREKSLTAEAIISGFKQAGLSDPIDINFYSEKDFAPSQVSSILAHVPASFPSIQTSTVSADHLPSPTAIPLSASPFDEPGNTGDGMDMGGVEDEDWTAVLEEPPADCEDNSETDGSGSDSDVDGSIPNMTPQSSGVTEHATRPQIPTAIVRFTPKAPSIPSTAPHHSAIIEPHSTTSLNKLPRAAIISAYSELSRSYEDLSQSLADEALRRVSAETHAQLAGFEIGQLRAAKAKGSKKKRVDVITEARLLTGTAGFELAQKQREEKEAQSQAKAAKTVQKKAASQAEQRNRHINGSTQVYRGPISKSRKAAELKDILHGLSLLESDQAKSVELNEEATVQVLVARIQAYLEIHPELAQNPRFSDLFRPKGQKRSTRAVTSENGNLATEDGPPRNRPRQILGDLPTELEFQLSSASESTNHSIESSAAIGISNFAPGPSRSPTTTNNSTIPTSQTNSFDYIAQQSSHVHTPSLFLSSSSSHPITYTSSYPSSHFPSTYPPYPPTASSNPPATYSHLHPSVPTYPSHVPYYYSNPAHTSSASDSHVYPQTL